MYASTIIYLALVASSHAIPLLRPNTNTPIQRRSADYEVVNVGGVPNPPQLPAVQTLIDTVTAPSDAPKTVTSTYSQTQTATIPSASSSLSTPCSSSSSFVTPTAAANPVPSVPGEEMIPRGLDRLARTLGQSIDSHLRARDGGNLTSNIKTKTGYSQLSARGANGTERVARFHPGVDRTELESPRVAGRSLNGTALRV